MQSSNRKALFVCSKPLQFLMACTIIEEYPAFQGADIYVVSKFIGVEQFLAAIERSPFRKLFNRIKLLDKHIDIPFIAKIESYNDLFLEDDRTSFSSIIKTVKSKNSSIVVNLFEEGFGTYYSEYLLYFKGLKKLKWIVDGLVNGSSLHYGGCKQTKNVYVQYPKLYQQLNPKFAAKTLIAGDVIEFIEKYLDFWQSESEFDLSVVKDKKVALITGNKGGYLADIRSIPSKEDYDLIFYKSHPHDGAGQNQFDENVVLINQHWFPAEALILLLRKLSVSIDVFYQSSTFGLYMNDLPKITFTNMIEKEWFMKVFNQRFFK